MKGLRTFIKMFLASVILFMFLAYIDEYENLLLPFFQKTEKVGSGKTPGGDDAEIKLFIQNFNSLLSQAYHSADPSRADILPADDSVKKGVADEIRFLIKNNKVMNVTVDDIKVDSIEMISPVAVRVGTRELVSLSYANLSEKKADTPTRVSEYRMLYTLIMSKGGWSVAGFEMMGEIKSTD